MPREPSPITVVLDTNVFLDIHSCHDLLQDVEKLASELGNADKAFDPAPIRGQSVYAARFCVLVS